MEMITRDEADGLKEAIVRKRIAAQLEQVG